MSVEDVPNQYEPVIHYNFESVLIDLPAIVGCLNWIALRTRPDVAWATSRAATLVAHDPSEALTRVQHICQYLLYTSTKHGYVPIARESRQCLWAMGDESFAPPGETSQQGVVLLHGVNSSKTHGGNLVQWRSSRQDLVAISTCEAEVIASSEALQQAEDVAIVI